MNDIPPIFKRKTYEGFMTQDLSRLRNNLQVSTKRSCSTILIKFFLSKYYTKPKRSSSKNLIKFFLLEKITANEFLGGGGGPGQDRDSEQPRPLRDHQGSHHTSAIFSINAFYHGSILALSAQLQPFSSPSSSS